MSAYIWDASARRFRDPSGRFISQTTIKRIKNDVISRDKSVVRRLVGDLVDGTIRPDQFVLSMRRQIKQTTMLEYMLGRGGRQAMTFSDHGRVGSILRNQYKYLNAFAEQIADGVITREAALSRAGLYIDTARAAYERGHAVAWDVRLPEYPAVHVNCQCSWTLSEHGTGSAREIRAYWRVNSSNPCRQCLDLRDQYNPLTIPAPL